MKRIGFNRINSEMVPKMKRFSKISGILMKIFILLSFIGFFSIVHTFAATIDPQSSKETNLHQTASGVGSEVDLLHREYVDNVVDLSIKTLGHNIEMQRWYKKHKWQWENKRHNLVFVYDPLNPEKIKTIVSNGIEYVRSSTGADIYTVAIASTDKIEAKDKEYRWSDKSGNWRLFDSNGRLVSTGNRIGIMESYIYDGEKIIGIKDRDDRQVLWLEYQGNNLIFVQDRENRKVEYSYTSNLLTSVKDVMGYITRYEYDGQSRLIKKINARGFPTYITYHKNGAVASVVDGKGVGNFFNYSYDKGRSEYYAKWKTSGGMIKEVWFDKNNDTIRVDVNGRTIKKIIKFNKDDSLPANVQAMPPGGVGRNQLIIDEKGNVTKKYYDEWENLTRVIKPDGTEIKYEYDLRFNLAKKMVNEQDVVTEMGYDDNGDLIREKEAVGTSLERVTEYTYSSGNLTSIKILGDSETPEAVAYMTYDPDGNISTLTDAEDNTTRFTSYNIMGNFLTRIDARNKEWKYTYYKNGNIETATDPLNYATQMFYDEVGNLVRQIDAETHETKFEYDNHNRMIKRIDALGSETLFAYNIDGKMIKQTDAEGKIVQYEYDNEGRMLKSIDGNANVIELVYDVPGGSGCASCGGGGSSQPARIKYPTFVKEFVYDNMGRKTEETDILDPLNPNSVKYISSFNYDKSGNLIYQKDKEGKITQYQYDILNRLISTRLTSGVSPLTTYYIYDNRDNLISLKDAKNQITRFTYDRNNRLTKETRPLGQSLNYTYDETGNLKTKIDSKNQKTEYVYDDTGKLQTVKYYNPVDPVNPVKNVSFVFDKIGNLKSYNDGTTQGQYKYDALYRKINETVNYGPFSKSFQYDYYKNSFKKTYTDPAGIAYTYSYNPNNQLASIDIPNLGPITYNIYQWIRPILITLPGGSTKEFHYDALMRIKQITSKDPAQNVLLNYQYTYDKMNNIRNKTTEHGNYNYGYDDLYRLTNETNPPNGTNQINYSYDPVGNRTTSISGTTVNWAYNQNNELQNYDGVTFQYDANGNIIQKTTDNGQQVTVNYIYDIENRLIQVKYENGTTIAKYEYDPFGRRLWKEVDGLRTYFLYCDEGLAGEFDSKGSLTKAYGYKPNSTWTTDPVFIREGESYYYYHNDHLGTPQKLTAQNGQVVWQAKYTAYGQADIDPASTIINNLRFAGQYFDEETALHYNYHRYYDPRSGRYITTDPLGVLGHFKKNGYHFNMIKIMGLIRQDVIEKSDKINHIYGFVENNPLKWIDPSGLKKGCECLPIPAPGNNLKECLKHAIDALSECYDYAVEQSELCIKVGREKLCPGFDDPDARKACEVGARVLCEFAGESTKALCLVAMGAMTANCFLQHGFCKLLQEL